MSFRSGRVCLSSLFLLLFTCCLPSAAQLSTATITGIVHDSTGGVVSGAKLTLHNLDTSIEMRAESNTSGNYVFLNITPGRYSLEATSSGFQTSKVPELEFVVNQTAHTRFHSAGGRHAADGHCGSGGRTGAGRDFGTGRRGGRETGGGSAL